MFRRSLSPWRRIEISPYREQRGWVSPRSKGWWSVNLQAGDLVRVEIVGPDDSWVSDASHRITGAVTPNLQKLQGDNAVNGTFSGSMEVLDFLVGTAAGLSVEAVRAMVAAAWRKHTVAEAIDDHEDAPPVGVPEIAVTMTADGVVEVRVRPSP